MRKTVQTEEKVKKELPSLQLSKDTISDLDEYLGLLLHWNKKMNLTAIRDYDQMVGKHLLDSLVAIEIDETNNLLNCTDNRTIDLGSGAGLPGIALSICLPKLNLVSIDKSSKKIAFQQQIVRSLALKNVQPIATRLQDFTGIQANKNAFDVIISRAFDQIKNILYFGDLLLKAGGYLVLWKGEKWKEELKEVDVTLLEKFKVVGSHRYEFKEYNHGGYLITIRRN